MRDAEQRTGKSVARDRQKNGLNPVSMASDAWRMRPLFQPGIQEDAMELGLNCDSQTISIIDKLRAGVAAATGRRCAGCCAFPANEVMMLDYRAAKKGKGRQSVLFICELCILVERHCSNTASIHRRR